MDDNFNLSYEINRYCKRITSNIKSKRKRQTVCDEYQAFVEEYVYNSALQGISEESAFNDALSELGDENKLEELLSQVNNQLNIPTIIKRTFLIFILVIALSSYLWVDNSSYRSYYILVLWILATIFLGYALYLALRYLRAIKLRVRLLLKLKKISKLNKEKLIIQKGFFASLLKKTEMPEIIYDTDKNRYIIKLWATVKGKKTLRFYDNGLYSYSANIGYANLPTNPRGHILTGGEVFCPQNIGYYTKFKNTHSEFVELKRGMHLLPDIKWQTHKHNNKDNINVLLLNPIPYSVFAIEKGRERKINDGDKLNDFIIWSGEGFISFLKNRVI